MPKQTRFKSIVLSCFLLMCVGTGSGQQKPQWVPGQVGLNAGSLPAPGFSYVNISIHYSAGAFIGPNGTPIPATGNYSVWAVENGFYYVSDVKILGANLGSAIVITPATGSLVADITIPPLGPANLSATAGGSGLSDTFVEPFALGWHEKRLDLQLAEAVVAPTGRYNPGATDNVGTGYFGNHVLMGATYYIKKNRGTSANLFTDWEVHGARPGTNNTSKTPGQAFTDEWGLGQILPLKKNMTQLLQLGGIGYDQWQVTANGGNVPIGSTGLTAPASLLPFYSVHAAGGQITYIAPLKHLAVYGKYEHEYTASSHFQGNTGVVGFAWTYPIPKPTAP